MATTATCAVLVCQKTDGTFETKQVASCPKEFLLSSPRGAYTGARTLDAATRIVDLSAHITRLAHSLQRIEFTETTNNNNSSAEQQDNNTASSVQKTEPLHVQTALAPYRDPVQLRPLVTPPLILGLQAFRQLYHLNKKQTDTEATHLCEAKLIILVFYSTVTNKAELSVHLSLLHEPKSVPCQILIFGAPRQHPSVKDSQWVRERELHDSFKDKNTNEVVLCDSTTQNIYEGISSNFFAVVTSNTPSDSNTSNTSNGLTVITAPTEHVLRGTIMRMTEEACRRLAIPIEYRFPTLKEARAGQWHGAFLTSTSRLVLPINVVDFVDDSSRIELPRCELVEQLRVMVEQEVQEKAEKII